MPDPRYSPATLALMGAGVSVTQLAKALETTPTSVSRWLRGHYQAPPELFGAVAALGGPHLARSIERLVEEARR